MPGDHRGVVTPDPIPNSEVKHSFADDTAGETLWKSRSLPGFFFILIFILIILIVYFIYLFLKYLF